MSSATNRPYPLTTVCETWRVARSSVYALRASLGGPLTSDRRQPGKRGPKTALSDEELVQEIRTVLKASPFLGEGHRKVKARLAAKGIRVGKNRVLRLMRAHGLLAPVRRGHPRGDRTHSGRIRTERPDELWGTDASRFWTKAEGWCWFFAAVDHCASDVVGWHVAKKGGVHLSAPLRNARGGQRSDRRLHRVLQHRLAPPAARVHDPGPCSREVQPKGGLMFKPPTCPDRLVASIRDTVGLQLSDFRAAGSDEALRSSDGREIMTQAPTPGQHSPWWDTGLRDVNFSCHMESLIDNIGTAVADSSHWNTEWRSRRVTSLW